MFKNARSIPEQYESNSKAWMVSSLFSSWLTKLDSRFVTEKRKVAMVVDNCPAHPNILKAITLVFLPPNTTSKSQPCDQGIIQNLKLHYRKHLILQLLTSIEAGTEFQFNLLDAIYLLRLAWYSVSPTTVARCFKHCGFVAPKDSPQDDADNDVDTDLDETREILSTVSLSVSIGDYLDVDQQVMTSEFLSDDDIVNSVTHTDETQDTSEDNTDVEKAYMTVST